MTEGTNNPNWVVWGSVRFRDHNGNLNKRPTPVCTLHGAVDVLLLLPGKTSAELRAKIVDVFVRFVGGAANLCSRGIPYVSYVPTCLLR